MVSPEALLRLRLWIFRLLLGALAVWGSSLIAEMLRPEDENILLPLGSLALLFMIASICALNCIAATRRRERIWPALVGLTMIVVAVVGVLVSTWANLGPGPVFRASIGLSIWALAWTLALSVFSERLPRRWIFLQRLTALAILALALTLSFADWEDSDRGYGSVSISILISGLAVMSVFGLLSVMTLAHFFRSGVRSLVPMTHVASMRRAMDFYGQLGFQCENSFTAPAETEPVWAWMETPGGAQLMLACASEPVIAAQQAVLFYVYCEDLPTKHAELLAKGIAAGPIETPFYAPRGQFRVTDPDGYALMLTHT